MKKQLTDRQENILIFIQQYVEENGYPPTLREIGKNFQISSTFGVKRHLDALEKKGYVNIESNASRGISIVRDDVFDSKIHSLKEDLFVRVPVVGRVAAGSPILATENIEGSVILDPSFIKNVGDAFALKVRGNSMIDAGIYENDLVIVDPNDKGKRGEIIVAMLDDEATVKRLEIVNGEIILVPENKNYEPIKIFKQNNFSIIGKVRGIVRWLN